MGEVERTVDALGRHPRAWSVVACGRNARLRARLAGRERVVTLGWRDDVPELMAAADVLVALVAGAADASRSSVHHGRGGRRRRGRAPQRSLAAAG
ncbi:hypothetical protein PHK61_24155 [Actinomycetospora lutea]|uniref:hypothetical protein n=1 Tax=Actinomycetospora lutea TaxID=663604 RepID=UPI002366FCA0|nr:hypothetical protein [Actinomycetospora lutea]MDD7941518.1 hypothetical protein [Actinomycetospora lutea]